MPNRTFLLMRRIPTHKQLKKWYENAIEVSFIDEDDIIYTGKIEKYDHEEKRLIYLEGNIHIPLRHIRGYSLESIFLTSDSDSPDRVNIKIGNTVLTINKSVLSSRNIQFFKSLLNNGMKESKSEIIDLGTFFSEQELGVLLAVIDYGSSHIVNDYQKAVAYLEASRKIAEIEMMEEAENLVKELWDATNNKFIKAIRLKNYKQISALIQSDIDINQKFGKYAITNKMKGNTFICIDDTPLTYAVRNEDYELVEFFLKNGADTEVFSYGDTPLMKACFNHNTKMVKLLLDAGANPNTVNKHNFSAMHQVYLRMREWLLYVQEKKVTDIVTLLFSSGYTGTLKDIKKLVTNPTTNKVFNLFEKIWTDQETIINSQRKKFSFKNILTQWQSTGVSKNKLEKSDMKMVLKSDYFPRSVLINIFNYLSTNELNKSKFICKDWYKIIVEDEALQTKSNINQDMIICGRGETFQAALIRYQNRTQNCYIARITNSLPHSDFDWKLKINKDTECYSDPISAMKSIIFGLNSEDFSKNKIVIFECKLNSLLYCQLFRKKDLNIIQKQTLEINSFICISDKIEDCFVAANPTHLHTQLIKLMKNVSFYQNIYKETLLRIGKLSISSSNTTFSKMLGQMDEKLQKLKTIKSTDLSSIEILCSEFRNSIPRNPIGIFPHHAFLIYKELMRQVPVKIDIINHENKIFLRHPKNDNYTRCYHDILIHSLSMWDDTNSFQMIDPDTSVLSCSSSNQI